METTNDQTSAPASTARVVLAGVLAVLAVIAVGVYEFAPGVLASIRAKVGISRPAAVAAEDPSVAEEQLEEADLDPSSPAKPRPALREAQAASQVKPGLKITR